GHGRGDVRRRLHRPAAAEETMTQDEQKRAVVQAALKYAQEGVIGVGSGSTVNMFIDALATVKGRIDGAVAASEASAERLKKHGIRVYELNSFNELGTYVDGADEVTENLHMVKGGGGALTREKIVAAVAKQFICICDASKLVGVLGKFPLPIEVIPMARSYVGRDVLLLSAAAFTSSASLRATDPLLPLIAEDYGVTTGAAAAAVTAFALAYGLLQVVCGPLGDRYGRYRTIAAAAFVSAFGSAACAAAPD